MKKPKHLDTYKKAAKKLGLKVKKITNGGNFSHGLIISGNNKTLFLAPKETGFYPRTSRWFTSLANNKMLAEQVLNQLGHKTIESILFDTRNISDSATLDKMLKKVHSFPVLVKPENGNQGRGIIIANNQTELSKYAHKLYKKDDNFMIQELIFGTEYRVLFINNKVYAAHTKEFPHVLGNGQDSIAKLLSEATFKIDENFLKSYLQSKNLTKRSIPEVAEKIPYNITRKGSTIFYALNDVPKPIQKWAKQTAKDLGTEVCGFDVFIPDDLKDFKNYQIIEINASPGFTYLASRYKQTALIQKICADVLRDYFKIN